MSEALFFVRMRGKISGPYGVEGLRRMVRQGMLSRIHEISADRVTWAGAAEYEELFPASAPPAIAPPAAVQPELTSAADELQFVADDTPSTPPLRYAPTAPPQFPPQPIYPPAYAPNYAPDYSPAYPPAAYSRGSQRAGESYQGMATTAMVLSLVGLLCFGFITGVLAIIFAGIALSGMSRTGNNSGKGMAITGLILGILDIIGWVIWLGVVYR